MNGMLRMKIKDGERGGECFRFKRVPTGPTGEKNLDILLGKIKLYFLSHYPKSTRRISVMFPT